MKKVMLVLGAAAALLMAGCNKGGTSDEYGTSSGNANSTSNSIPSTPSNSASNSPAQ